MRVELGASITAGFEALVFKASDEIEEERKKRDQRLRDQQFYTRSLVESNIKNHKINDFMKTTDKTLEFVKSAADRPLAGTAADHPTQGVMERLSRPLASGNPYRCP